MKAMPYPTTVILLAVVGAVFGLGWQGTIDGAAVTSIFGAIVSGVLVGHYVKTSNGHTTTTTEEGGVRTTTTAPVPVVLEDKDSL